MITYVFFRLASRVVPLLPVWLIYVLAWLAGEAAYRLARGPREAVRANLRRVLGPEASSQRLSRAVRGVFRTAAYNYTDMFLIPHIPPEELAQRVDIQNPQSFLDAYARRKGMVLTTAHFGNFDLLVQISVVHHIPVTVLIEQLSPPQLHQLVVRLRSSHGVRLIPTSPKALRELVRVLREGGVVVVATDRAVQGRGQRVPFFGEETRLPTGAVELAMRTGAALVMAFGQRLPGRRYRITIEPPLELGQGQTTPEGVAKNLARVASILEAQVRRHPEQWVVFEPLWGKEAADAEEVKTGEPRPAGALR